MGEIIICAADELVEKVKIEKPAAVLSIEHPGATPDKGGAPRLTDGTKQKILTFWDSEQPVTLGPDIHEIEQGIAYVMENIVKGDVIIHCHGGIARSTAVALGVLAQLHPHMDEKALIDKLLQIRPQAKPNMLVVEMADQLAGRGGKLVAAVKNHPVLQATRAKAEEGRQSWLQENMDSYKKMHPEKFPKP